MREIAMRQSAQLVLLMSLTFFTGAAHAVDRGQFENVPDDIRAWFKGVRSPHGVPAATFPMDIARSMTCELELIGFQSMVCGGGRPKRRLFETAATRVVEPPVWM